MPTWLKAFGIVGSLAAVIGTIGYVAIADKWASIFVIIALVISLLNKSLLLSHS